MEKDNRKKYMSAFDKVKKKYDDESKELKKNKIVNNIKDDTNSGCKCKG